MMKTHYPFLVLVTAMLLLKAQNTDAQVDAGDSLALVALYNSTDGSNSVNHSNWLTKQPASSWFGVGVNGSRVWDLHLDNNNLNGSIPPELGNLTELEELYLNNNQLSESIPSELGQFTNLDIFNLSSNQLSGSIPPELSNIKPLYWLNIFFNTIN